MYFSRYSKSGKKSYIKRNRFKKKGKGLYAGMIRFIKLMVIIASIVPLLYLIDRGYQAFAGAAQWGAVASLNNYLKIRSIKVRGNTFVAEDELAPYLQGLEGHNIFTVNIKDMANRVKTHPWIKEASVRRELPDTIFIEISERTPAVYVDNHGELYLADEEGVIFGDKADDLLNLPVVYGVDLPKRIAESKSPVGGLLPAIEVKRELASIPWIDMPSTGIEVDEKGQIVLHLKGYRIKLGRGGYKEKLARFYEITKNLQDKGIPYKEVDLRFDKQVIIKTFKVI